MEQIEIDVKTSKDSSIMLCDIFYVTFMSEILENFQIRS